MALCIDPQINSGSIDLRLEQVISPIALFVSISCLPGGFESFFLFLTVRNILVQ